jgi:hypothetical protein
METLEEKAKNLRSLLRASEEGDVATVRAVLESGYVDLNGVDDLVRLLSALRQTAHGFCVRGVGAVDVALVLTNVAVWMLR